MNFEIILQPSAENTLAYLETNDPKKYRKILKTLGLMECNIRHPSLNTHKYFGLFGPNGEEVFEAYVENKIPAAYRVFWYYGPETGKITVLAITAHP